MWQMGAITLVDHEWITQYGMPEIVMPIFMVKEAEKYRPIMDARYANVALQPDWFQLPTILGFMAGVAKRGFDVQN